MDDQYLPTILVTDESTVGEQWSYQTIEHNGPDSSFEDLKNLDPALGLFGLNLPSSSSEVPDTSPSFCSVDDAQSFGIHDYNPQVSHAQYGNDETHDVPHSSPILRSAENAQLFGIHDYNQQVNHAQYGNDETQAHTRSYVIGWNNTHSWNGPTTQLPSGSGTGYSVAGSSAPVDPSDFDSVTSPFPTGGPFHPFDQYTGYAPSARESNNGDLLSVASMPPTPSRAVKLHSNHSRFAADRTHVSRTQSAAVSRSRNRRENNKFACPLCPERMAKSDGLLRHMKIHDPLRKAGFRAKCSDPSCEKAFETPKDKRRHEKIHKDASLSCLFPDCLKMFRRTDNLKRHIVNIHEVPEKDAGRYIPKQELELVPR